MLIYLFRHDYEPAVLCGIFTGGEGNEFISIFRGHARIIQGKFPALPDISVKLVLILRIHKIIVTVTLRTVRNSLEYGNDFILCLLCERVKLDGLVSLIKALGFVIFQSPEGRLLFETFYEFSSLTSCYC